MEARLSFGNNALTVSRLSYSPQDAESGNPCNTSFRLAVASDGFSGAGEWVCAVADLVRFTAALEAMEGLRPRRAELLDRGYGSRLALELDKRGHIHLSGLLYGPAAEQRLQWGFTADQTALGPFVRGLRAILEGAAPV